ncbi:MAG: hypothetical protein H7A40_01855 [Chlamydiales bacterium]|nr:hypothetical protein [Chlamydiales bacterium]
MSTNLIFNHSLEGRDFGLSELEIDRRHRLAESILMCERPFGYASSLLSRMDIILKRFEEEAPRPINGLVGSPEPSFFGRLFKYEKKVKLYIASQKDINVAVQNVLHNQYQTRGVRSPLSSVEIGLFYLIDAFDSYLTSDLKIIKETYTGEANSFADKINQYYMHFDLNTKTSLVGRQIKACIDNSKQLHRLLKK